MAGIDTPVPPPPRPAPAGVPAAETRPAAARSSDELSAGHLDLGPDGMAGSPSWRSTVRWFCVGLAALLLAVVALNAWVDPYGVLGHRAYPPAVVDAVTRGHKVKLVQQLDRPPQVLLLGSSTANNFDPARVRELTGKRAFNGALSAGRPADAFAMASLVDERFPGRFPHLVYLVDVDGTFAHNPPNGGLLAQRPLLRQFDARERAWVIAGVMRPYLSMEALKMSAGVIRGTWPVPKVKPVEQIYRADGFRLRDSYQGRPLQPRMRRETDRYRSTIYEHSRFDLLGGMERRFVRRLVQLAVARGDTPTLVLLPAHPWAVDRLTPHGYLRRRQLVRKQLEDLAANSGARFEDLSALEAFGGQAADFSDNVHMREPNATRALEELARRGAL